MKFLPIRDLDNVTTALNFDTPACHVTGGCDLYTTKAAGADRKLYKTINDSLESQHESLIRVSASLSPPHAEMLSLNLSRSSPFGPLSQVSSRRTFAYLIATLNASHPDYDFSYILRPTDFRHEKRLQAVVNTIDETLNNVRPRLSSHSSALNGWSSAALGPSQNLPEGAPWSPKCWKAIDQEMDLKDCDIFSYNPDDDPLDAEESAIWSINYFFFNKQRKRVCYIYARGLSTTSHSPLLRAVHNTRRGSVRAQGIGAEKRAKYWLGESAVGTSEAWDEDEDDGFVLDADEEEYLDPIPSDMEQDDEPHVRHQRGSSGGINEHMTDTMEL